MPFTKKKKEKRIEVKPASLRKRKNGRGRNVFWDNDSQRIRAYRYFKRHIEIPHNDYERVRFRQMDRDGTLDPYPRKTKLDYEIYYLTALLKQFILLFREISQMEDMGQLNLCWNNMIGQYIDMHAVMLFLKQQKMKFTKPIKKNPRMEAVIYGKTKKQTIA